MKKPIRCLVKNIYFYKIFSKIKGFGTDKKFVKAGSKPGVTKTPGPIYEVSDQFKYNKVKIKKFKLIINNQGFFMENRNGKKK